MIQKVSRHLPVVRWFHYRQAKLLTVAHWIERWKAKDFKVWVEDHSIRTFDGESHHVVCGITKRPEYRKMNTYKHDITILHLCEHLTYRKGKFYIF